MNSLAHIKIANADDPLFNLGAIIPDIFSLLNISKSHNEKSYPSEENPLIKGIKIHLLSDRIFHSKEYVEEHKKIPKIDERGVIEHFLLELCIDHLILNSEYEKICKKINSIDKLISSESKEIKNLKEYFGFDKKMSKKFYEETKKRLDYSLSYNNEEGIIEGINRVMTRMELDNLPKEEFYFNVIFDAIQNIKLSYLNMLESIRKKVYNEL